MHKNKNVKRLSLRGKIMSYKIEVIKLFFLIIGMTSCGGGGGNSSHFDSVSGTWEIAAQKVISADCGTLVGGFSDIITITTRNNVLNATVPAFSDDTTITGFVTNDGFVLEASTPAAENSQVKYIITVNGIPQIGDNALGESSYSYQYVFADGSTSCEFTATGSATHLSD